MRILIITCAFILNAVLTSAQQSETLSHTASWAETLDKAGRENKFIFVDCYFTGCMPCAQMDREVFPNPMVRDELQKNFVAIKVDVFKEKLGDTLNMKYAVSGYPTFLVLDSKGRMLSIFVGYHDPGKLLTMLNEAKDKAGKKEFLSGFAVTHALEYPEFYKKYYARDGSSTDPDAAIKWIKNQKDWTAETVALPIFRTGRLDTEIETYLIDHYIKYRTSFGEALVIEKAASILNRRLKDFVGNKENENAFRKFLLNHSGKFPAADWRILNFLLGYNYYGSVAKDTAGLLKFINEDPLIYMNYVGSLYSNLLVRKQLDDSNLKLLASWADKAVTIDASFDMIRTAADIHKKLDDQPGYRRFINMAINRAKKYGMPTETYEKQLAAVK